MVKTYVVTIDGDSYEVAVQRKYGAQPVSSVQTPAYSAAAPAARPAAPIPPSPAPSARPAAPAPAASAAPAPSAGSRMVNAPMNGTILSVKVSNGQTVREGQVLFTLEAMKMENEIMSPISGTVSGVSVTAGASVDSGAYLCSVG